MNTDFDRTAPAKRHDPMRYGVLHEGLQHQRRNRGIEQFRRHDPIHTQTIAKSPLLDSNVTGHQIQLTSQAGLLHPGLNARGTQNLGEVGHHILGRQRIDPDQS
jgi:hypothetical protein